MCCRFWEGATMVSCNIEETQGVQVPKSAAHTIYSVSQQVEFKVFVQVVLSDWSRNLVVVWGWVSHCDSAASRLKRSVSTVTRRDEGKTVRHVKTITVIIKNVVAAALDWKFGGKGFRRRRLIFCCRLQAWLTLADSRILTLHSFPGLDCQPRLIYIPVCKAQILPNRASGAAAVFTFGTKH